MFNRQSFVDACLAGNAFLSDIDDYIATWHDSDDSRLPELPEFLGMTSDEYRLWVERPESLRFILAAHKDRVPVADFVLRQPGLIAAARSDDRSEAVQVLRWLIETGRVDGQLA